MKTPNPPSILLDYWTPPKFEFLDENNGHITPIGFVCTSFTFDADFFDDECLTRFLSMETEKEADGAAFLVEREEKLAGLRGGIVLVDQHHCKGGRSLRWDFVSCRVKNGILHAKVAILHWSHCIRIIISSANLTPNGYCINQEIFGVIDYYQDSKEDLKIANDILRFLEGLVDHHCGQTVGGRFGRTVAEIRAALKKWNIENRNFSKDEISMRLLLIDPKNRDGFNQLREIWADRTSSPPDSAYVTSPFFDLEEKDSAPSRMLPAILKQRGNIEVTYQLTTEPVTETGKSILVRGPAYLANSSRSNCVIFFRSIDEFGKNEENKEVPRPLHRKSIWLQNDDMNLLLAGSSNFTSAAFGLGRRANYEANLVYTVSRSRNTKAYKQLASSYIDGEILDKKFIRFQEIVNEDEPTEDADQLLLPSFFGEAVLRNWGDTFLIEVNFLSDDVPMGFEIACEVNKKHVALLNMAEWMANGSKVKLDIEWRDNFTPDHLLVRWTGVQNWAFWPIVLESQVTLPPVASLRNLSLEALAYILSSSQPLHRLLKTIQKFSKDARSGKDNDPVVDVHRLVDTSAFLLQRTRRISYAMKALSARLEKPVFTEESLKWRLHGPIGVQSLIDAISREAKTIEEKEFLMAELALELSRIQPTETEVSLSSSKVRFQLKNIVLGIKTEFLKSTMQDEVLKTYCSQAVNKAIDAF